MPIYKNSDAKGDMYVVLSIEMPDEHWLSSIDQNVSSMFCFRGSLLTVPLALLQRRVQTLQSLLPPKKTDVSPAPAIVDEAEFEESDILDVRGRSFPPGSDFFDHGFHSQFGEGDDDWEDDDDEDPYDEDGAEPECRQQ